MLILLTERKRRFFFIFLVNLKVSSFDLILCLEYLMKILQFVSVPEDESVANTKPGPASTTVVAKSKFWFFSF